MALDLAWKWSIERLLIALALVLLGTASWLGAQPYDVVITGGRVIDPETRLDAVRDVGIVGREIAAISTSPLTGSLADGGLLIDARDHVVAPGFIDLHAHGQSNKAHGYQALDGVTTALELEWGYPKVAEWLASKRDQSILNYGATVSHGMLRSLLMPDLESTRAEIEAQLSRAASEPDPLRVFQGAVAAGFYQELPPAKLPDLYDLLREGLEEGALGFGVAHQYYPGASRSEILRVFELSAELQAPIYTHVRSMTIGAMQEVIANAAVTGAPLHIVHVNSMSLGELPTVLELIGSAQKRGLDITTEAYPYTAGSTGITSAIFDDGWQERLGISYGDVQWEATSERLTKETFELFREEGGTVIIHIMKPEMIDLAMKTPFVIVASDGMPYAPGAHPRSAGTYARVLGRYVRERGVLSLSDAINKMTLLPARRLETIAPAAARKGRVQVGADADLVVFDPETIIDTATFEDDLSASVGMKTVLVGGTAVVSDGELVDDVFPGRPLLGRYTKQ